MGQIDQQLGSDREIISRVLVGRAVVGKAVIGQIGQRQGRQVRQYALLIRWLNQAQDQKNFLFLKYDRKSDDSSEFSSIGFTYDSFALLLTSRMVSEPSMLDFFCPSLKSEVLSIFFSPFFGLLTWRITLLTSKSRPLLAGIGSIAAGLTCLEDGAQASSTIFSGQLILALPSGTIVGAGLEATALVIPTSQLRLACLQSCAGIDFCAFFIFLVETCRIFQVVWASLATFLAGFQEFILSTSLCRFLFWATNTWDSYFFFSYCPINSRFSLYKFRILCSNILDLLSSNAEKGRSLLLSGLLLLPSYCYWGFWLEQRGWADEDQTGLGGMKNFVWLDGVGGLDALRDWAMEMRGLAGFSGLVRVGLGSLRQLVLLAMCYLYFWMGSQYLAQMLVRAPFFIFYQMFDSSMKVISSWHLMCSYLLLTTLSTTDFSKAMLLASSVINSFSSSFRFSVYCLCSSRAITPQTCRMRSLYFLISLMIRSLISLNWSSTAETDSRKPSLLVLCSDWHSRSQIEAPSKQSRCAWKLVMRWTHSTDFDGFDDFI